MASLSPTFSSSIHLSRLFCHDFHSRSQSAALSVTIRTFPSNQASRLKAASISGFSEVAQTVAHHAVSRELRLDEHTQVNLRSLGVELPDDKSEPAEPPAHVADEGGRVGR